MQHLIVKVFVSIAIASAILAIAVGAPIFSTVAVLAIMFAAAVFIWNALPSWAQATVALIGAYLVATWVCGLFGTSPGAVFLSMFSSVKTTGSIVATNGTNSSD